jgi:hypothetical protein
MPWNLTKRLQDLGLLDSVHACKSGLSATACAMACATGVKTGDICVNLGLNFFEKNNHDGFMMDS